jgi:nucleoside-diphosphate-sugar epimerase
MSFFAGRAVLVTGGASFIGSHLVEALVETGADVRVADDLSSGRVEHLAHVIDRIELLEGNLKHWDVADAASRDCEIVFHLAADHGGRGYISSHPANCVANMALDNIVIETAVANGVDRITFASSACVYPTDLQQHRVRLREDMVSFAERGGAFADEEYGWAKLMAEMALLAHHRQHGVKTAAVRIFTAYGPRENESHAIIALIARAMIRQSPFEMWGDGTQTRNFTYVDDVVRALMLACQHVDDGTAVNAGTPDFISLQEAADCIFDLVGWVPPGGIRHLTDKPVGVRHRAADTALAARRLGWEPLTSFRDGLEQTIEWYLAHHVTEQVRAGLPECLLER